MKKRTTQIILVLVLLLVSFIPKTFASEQHIKTLRDNTRIVSVVDNQEGIIKRLKEMKRIYKGTNVIKSVWIGLNDSEKSKFDISISDVPVKSCIEVVEMTTTLSKFQKVEKKLIKDGWVIRKSKAKKLGRRPGKPIIISVKMKRTIKY